MTRHFLKFNRRYLGYLAIGLIVLVSTVLLKILLTDTIQLDGKFSRQEVEINAYDLNDIGIADVNGDTYLDVFTTNHSARQSLLVNQKGDRFVDELIDYGISQDSQFPGAEVSNQIEKEKMPGLYIFRKDKFRFNKEESDNVLVLTTKDLGSFREKSGEKIEGIIEIFSSASIKEIEGFSASVEEKQVSSDSVRSLISFSADENNGRLVVETHLTALPTTLNLNSNIALKHVFVGNNRINPDSHQFDLLWRDRHGMAWADYDGDQTMDVFISRGGLKGQIESVSEATSNINFSDELFSKGRDSSTRLANVTAQSNIEKKACPGRQTAWVDANSDGKLDLYTVCGRGVPPLGNSPNQLYQQVVNTSSSEQESLSERRFTDIAPVLGLDHLENGTFLWIDRNNDGRSDLLWATEEALTFYLNKGQSFEAQSPIAHQKGSIKKLSVADFDADNDIDILVLGTRGSLLLRKEEAEFSLIEPDSIGLPQKAATVQWVDYDSDGLVDLHTIPHGLYRQGSDGRFENVQLLKNTPHFSKITGARSLWFDADQNGTTDVLIATRPRSSWLSLLEKATFKNIPDPRGWDVTLLKNQETANNWLQVKLKGSADNPQAIGALVSIQTQRGQQLHQVGEAEGSFYSQGHYRIYAGLGQTSQIEKVTVTWPDGETQTLVDVPSNQLLQITQTT